MFLMPSAAFTVSSQRNLVIRHSQGQKSMDEAKLTKLHMGFFGGDDEVKKLTRDNEPEQYFRTNTDKMTDQEKIPLAVGGILFITVPFIFGLIALYASK